jgi:hypothetical protein
MKRTPLILIVIGLTSATGMASAEDVYKWVDADGHLHFGSQPPAQANARKMAPSSADPAAATSAPTWQQQMGQAGVRRVQKQQREDQDARKQQELAQRCLSAQRSLDTLNRERPVYSVNGQGEREYLSDAQRQSAVAAANQRVAAYCR